LLLLLLLLLLCQLLHLLQLHYFLTSLFKLGITLMCETEMISLLHSLVSTYLSDFLHHFAISCKIKC
jgi:hypothetical protein